MIPGPVGILQQRRFWCPLFFRPIFCGTVRGRRLGWLLPIVVEANPVDAVVLGGTGLQETEIRSIQNALRPMKIDAFAAHAEVGKDHAQVMEEMTNRGYEFMVTQIASDGLMQWLGKIINKDNIQQLFADAHKFGFHTGGEGGYYDSYAICGPIFGDKKIEILETEKVVDDQYCGHIVFKKIGVVTLPLAKKISIVRISP